MPRYTDIHPPGNDEQARRQTMCPNELLELFKKRLTADADKVLGLTYNPGEPGKEGTFSIHTDPSFSGEALHNSFALDPGAYQAVKTYTMSEKLLCTLLNLPGNTPRRSR